MAAVTGPISSLPGHSHDVPNGAVCDTHPDRPAVVRLQGETDSFGSELHDLCEECAAEWREEARNADTSGTCEWCHEHKPKLAPMRDSEEGMYGRVYQVCADCRKRDHEYWASQIDDFDD